MPWPKGIGIRDGTKVGQCNDWVGDWVVRRGEDVSI